VKLPPYTALAGRLPMLIAGVALPTVKLCGLPVTAKSSVVAVALAVKVQGPTPTKLTMPLDTVHTPVVLEVTDSVGAPAPE